MRTIPFAALCLCAVAGFGLITIAEERRPDLRRVNCVELTVFAPLRGLSDEELCRSYGGLAAAGAAPADAGLVILVRNLPMGGAAGLLPRDNGS